MPLIDPTQFIPDYIKTYSQTKTQTQVNKRVLLIGLSGWGKSYSLETTAPNPIILDTDNQLPPEVVERIRAGGVFVAPFYDKDWVKASLKVSSISQGIMQFLSHDAMQFTVEQTLIIDTLSTVADALTEDLKLRTPKGKDGNDDGYWFWRMWAEWLGDFCTLLKKLRCNVALIAHETEMRETDSGKFLGYRWWLPGQAFSPRLPAFFTDVFRQIKMTTNENGQALQGTITEKTKVKTSYWWQCHPTQAFPPAKTTIPTNQLLVPATWESFSIK